MYLSGSDWRICTRMRLGMPIPELRRLSPCPCPNSLVVPTEPQHPLRCNRVAGGAIHAVHTALRRAVAGVVLDSGLGSHVRQEDSDFFAGVQGPAGAESLRPDVTFKRRSAAPFPPTDCCLDVTVTTTAPHNNPSTAVAGAAAQASEVKTVD